MPTNCNEPPNYKITLSSYTIALLLHPSGFCSPLILTN